MTAPQRSRGRLRSHEKVGPAGLALVERLVNTRPHWGNGVELPGESAHGLEALVAACAR